MTGYDPEDGSVADAHISSQDSECNPFEDTFPERQAPADTSSGSVLSTLPTGGTFEADLEKLLVDAGFGELPPGQVQTVCPGGQAEPRPLAVTVMMINQEFGWRRRPGQHRPVPPQLSLLRHQFHHQHRHHSIRQHANPELHWCLCTSGMAIIPDLSRIRIHPWLLVGGTVFVWCDGRTCVRASEIICVHFVAIILIATKVCR